MGLKLFSPAVQHRAGDPEFLTYFLLRAVPLHAFQHHLQFVLCRITLPFAVHVIQYLSLFLCVFYQVLDNRQNLHKRMQEASATKQAREEELAQLAVLEEYAAMVEAALNVESLAPFNYGGLAMQEALTHI